MLYTPQFNYFQMAELRVIQLRIERTLVTEAGKTFDSVDTTLFHEAEKALRWVQDEIDSGYMNVDMGEDLKTGGRVHYYGIGVCNEGRDLRVIISEKNVW